jgi:hypothetical protein
MLAGTAVAGPAVLATPAPDQLHAAAADEEVHPPAGPHTHVSTGAGSPSQRIPKPSRSAKAADSCGQAGAIRRGETQPGNGRLQVSSSIVGRPA